VDLSHSLGTDKYLSEILAILENEKNAVIQVTAAPGRGKSWIADKLEELSSTKSFSCIHLFGDSELMQELYYPFKKFIEKKDRRYSKGITALKETIGEIPYLGKGVKALIDDFNFKNQKVKKKIDEVEPFNKHLPFSFHLAGLIKKGGNVVIVADDLNFFDEGTIRFLTALNSGLIEVFPSSNISIVHLASENVTASFGVNSKFTLNLPPLTVEQASQALEFWSEKRMNTIDTETIYSCTGGHLQLIKLVSYYLKEVTTTAISKNFKELLIWVVESRLKSARTQYEKLKNLIVSVSSAGAGSSSSELICLLDNDRETQELIRQGIQMDLLVIRDNYIHFSHSIVEDYVLSLKSKRTPDFYFRLSECIRKLSPGNYARRATIMASSGRIELADIYWALSAIQKFQQGSIDAGLILSERISESPEGMEIRSAIYQFAVCYANSVNGLIDETISEVEAIPNTLPKLILAERYYLKCLSLAKRISNTAKEEALSIIEDWEELKEEETEIWYRFSQVKIIAAAELGKLDLALRTEAAIIKYYSARLAIDIQARSILERLNLFSEVLYSPEIAHKKMLHLEAQLSKSLLSEHYDRLIDLYISRTNLASNSFMIDEFQKSLEFAAGAIKLLHEFGEIKFPYPEAPQNNYLISLLFSDMNQLQYITERYSYLSSITTKQENKILVTINLAGLQLLNDRPYDALNVLQNGDYIPRLTYDDWYYCYYYWINYALVCFLLGKREDALNAVNSLESAPDNISPFLIKYYKMHHQLMKEMIATRNFSTYSQVSGFIQEHKPFYSSRIWQRFKSGYLFTDMQIWTSS
jgi:hypothetical protein